MRRIFVLVAAGLMSAASVFAQTDTGNSGKQWMYEDTIAEPVTIMKELLVTPDGSDPVTYILNNVYRRAKSNRKKLTYNATVTTDVVVRDADIIPKVMPKTLMWAAEMYLRTKGKWALMDYAISHKKAEAQMQTNQTCTNGKIKYSGGKILNAPADMRKKVGKQLMEMNETDPFDELYGDMTLCDPKYRQKFAIYMDGSYEENGKLIFVLKARRYHGELHETQTLHIVDREWGIIRAEYNTRIFRSYWQSKNIGGGIYMPWRKVDNPVQFNLKQAVEKGRNLLEKKKKVKNMERKTLGRAEKLLDGDRDYRPMIKIGYEINYSKVN